MAAFLRTHRRRAGLTLEGLAEQTGLTKSYLSKVERGYQYPRRSRWHSRLRVCSTPMWGGNCSRTVWREMP